MSVKRRTFDAVDNRLCLEAVSDPNTNWPPRSELKRVKQESL